jgi:hypothetical protein
MKGKGGIFGYAIAQNRPVDPEKAKTDKLARLKAKYPQIVKRLGLGGETYISGDYGKTAIRATTLKDLELNQDKILSMVDPAVLTLRKFSKGFIPNFNTTEEAIRNRNLDQIKWMREQAKKRGISLNDPNTVFKLGIEYAQLSRSRKFGINSGFIPNFAYKQAVMNFEERMSGEDAIYSENPFPHIRNKSQPTFASAIADHGGLGNAISDSMHNQSAAKLINRGFIPNFAYTPYEATDLRNIQGTGKRATSMDNLIRVFPDTAAKLIELNNNLSTLSSDTSLTEEAIQALTIECYKLAHDLNIDIRGMSSKLAGAGNDLAAAQQAQAAAQQAQTAAQQAAQQAQTAALNERESRMARFKNIYETPTSLSPVQPTSADLDQKVNEAAQAYLMLTTEAYLTADTQKTYEDIIRDAGNALGAQKEASDMLAKVTEEQAKIRSENLSKFELGTGGPAPSVSGPPADISQDMIDTMISESTDAFNKLATETNLSADEQERLRKVILDASTAMGDSAKGEEAINRAREKMIEKLSDLNKLQTPKFLNLFNRSLLKTVDGQRLTTDETRKLQKDIGRLRERYRQGLSTEEELRSATENLINARNLSAESAEIVREGATSPDKVKKTGEEQLNMARSALTFLGPMIAGQLEQFMYKDKSRAELSESERMGKDFMGTGLTAISTGFSIGGVFGAAAGAAVALASAFSAAELSAEELSQALDENASKQLGALGEIKQAYEKIAKAAETGDTKTQQQGEDELNRLLLKLDKSVLSRMEAAGGIGSIDDFIYEYKKNFEVARDLLATSDIKLPELEPFLTTFSEKFTEYIGNFFEGISGLVIKGVSMVKTITDKLKEQLTPIATQFTNGIADAFEALKDRIVKAINSLKFWKDNPPTAPNATPKQIGGIIRAANGMYINGSGSGDKYPALLENGEYVLNRNAVRALGGKTVLDNLNFNSAPRFQTGGSYGYVTMEDVNNSTNNRAGFTYPDKTFGEVGSLEINEADVKKIAEFIVLQLKLINTKNFVGNQFEKLYGYIKQQQQQQKAKEFGDWFAQGTNSSARNVDETNIASDTVSVSAEIVEIAGLGTNDIQDVAKSLVASQEPKGLGNVDNNFKSILKDTFVKFIDNMFDSLGTLFGLGGIFDISRNLDSIRINEKYSKQIADDLLKTGGQSIVSFYGKLNNAITEGNFLNEYEANIQEIIKSPSKNKREDYINKLISRMRQLKKGDVEIFSEEELKAFEKILQEYSSAGKITGRYILQNLTNIYHFVSKSLENAKKIIDPAIQSPGAIGSMKKQMEQAYKDFDFALQMAAEKRKKDLEVFVLNAQDFQRRQLEFGQPFTALETQKRSDLTTLDVGYAGSQDRAALATAEILRDLRTENAGLYNLARDIANNENFAPEEKMRQLRELLDKEEQLTTTEGINIKNKVRAADEQFQIATQIYKRDLEIIDKKYELLKQEEKNKRDPIYQFKAGMASLSDEAALMTARFAHDIPRQFAQGMSQAINEIARGTKSVENAFTDIAINFLNQLSDAMMTSAIMNAIGAIVPNSWLPQTNNLFGGGGGTIINNNYNYSGFSSAAPVSSGWTSGTTPADYASHGMTYGQQGGFFQNKKIIRAQNGMYISGGRTGDKNLAMLEDGEYVLNRNAVRKMGGKNALDSINFARLPRFQSGGGFGGYSMYPEMDEKNKDAYTNDIILNNQNLGKIDPSAFSSRAMAEDEYFVKARQEALDKKWKTIMEDYEKKVKRVQLITGIISAVGSSLVSIGAAGLGGAGGAGEAAGKSAKEGAKTGLDTGKDVAKKTLLQSISEFSGKAVNFVGENIGKAASFVGKNISEGMKLLANGKIGDLATKISAPALKLVQKLWENKTSRNLLLSLGQGGLGMGAAYLSGNIAKQQQNKLQESVGYGTRRQLGGYIKFNSGGYVPYGSRLSDTIPALLTGGEYVMNNKAVKKYGLGTMNSMNVGAYQAGGQVENNSTSNSTSNNSTNVSINVDRSGKAVYGAETSSYKQNDVVLSKQLAKQVNSLVLKSMVNEKRYGGELYKNPLRS